MKIEITEEERKFLEKICDRASKLCHMAMGKTEFYREPWNWVSDCEKADLLLKKLKKEK